MRDYFPIYKDGVSFPNQTTLPSSWRVTGPNADSAASQLIVQQNMDVITQFVNKQRQAYALSGTTVHRGQYIASDLAVAYYMLNGMETVTIIPHPTPVTPVKPVTPRPFVPQTPLVGVRRIPIPIPHDPLCLMVFYKGTTGENGIAAIRMDQLQASAVSAIYLSEAGTSNWAGVRTQVMQAKFGATGAILSTIDFTPDSGQNLYFTLFPTTLSGGQKTSASILYEPPIMNGTAGIAYTALDAYSIQETPFQRTGPGGDAANSSGPFAISPDGDYYYTLEWNWSAEELRVVIDPSVVVSFLPASVTSEANTLEAIPVRYYTTQTPPTVLLAEYGASIQGLIPPAPADPTWQATLSYTSTPIGPAGTSVPANPPGTPQPPGLPAAPVMSGVGYYGQSKAGGAIKLAGFMQARAAIGVPGFTLDVAVQSTGGDVAEFGSPIPWPVYSVPSASNSSGGDTLAVAMLPFDATASLPLKITAGDVTEASLDWTTPDSTADMAAGSPIGKIAGTFVNILTQANSYLALPSTTTFVPPPFISPPVAGTTDITFPDVGTFPESDAGELSAAFAAAGDAVGSFPEVSYAVAVGGTWGYDTPQEFAKLFGVTIPASLLDPVQLALGIIESTAHTAVQLIPWPPSLSDPIDDNHGKYYYSVINLTTSEVFVSGKLTTPFGTYTMTTQNSFTPWLHVSNGQHWIQGYSVDSTPYLFLDGADFLVGLTQALNCQATDLRAMFMDIPLSVVQSVSDVTITSIQGLLGG